MQARGPTEAGHGGARGLLGARRSGGAFRDPGWRRGRGPRGAAGRPLGARPDGRHVVLQAQVPVHLAGDLQARDGEAQVGEVVVFFSARAVVYGIHIGRPMMWASTFVILIGGSSGSPGSGFTRAPPRPPVSVGRTEERPARERGLSILHSAPVR